MGVNILAAFECEPPELDFVWTGFLSGTVGALVAPGATGKSFWALQAAMAVAGSEAGGDILDLKPAKAGRVIYLAGEDPEPPLIRRIHAIGKHLSSHARDTIALNLNLETVMGGRLDVMDERHLQRLVEYSIGARLIVLDTLSRIHRLDENSNGAMAGLIANLEYVAKQTGAAVLYLHHTSKGSASNGQLDQQQAARGASSLIDNARWCGYVAKMTPQEAVKLSADGGTNHITDDERGQFVRFGISKQNYDVTPLDRWYQRAAGGVLLPAHLVEFNHESSSGRNEGRRRDAL